MARRGDASITRYVAELSSLSCPPEEAHRQPDGSRVLALGDGSTLRWTIRPDGSWRKPERRQAGWIGELEQPKYRPGGGLLGVSEARHKEIRSKCREFHSSESNYFQGRGAGPSARQLGWTAVDEGLPKVEALTSVVGAARGSLHNREGQRIDVAIGNARRQHDLVVNPTAQPQAARHNEVRRASDHNDLDTERPHAPPLLATEIKHVFMSAELPAGLIELAAQWCRMSGATCVEDVSRKLERLAAFCALEEEETDRLRRVVDVHLRSCVQISGCASPARSQAAENWEAESDTANRANVPLDECKLGDFEIHIDWLSEERWGDEVSLRVTLGDAVYVDSVDDLGWARGTTTDGRQGGASTPQHHLTKETKQWDTVRSVLATVS